MIVLLTYGEYSDFGIDDLLEVESLDIWNELVRDYAVGNPCPVLEETSKTPWCDLDDATQAWKAGLLEALLASGLVTKAAWTEVHRSERHGEPKLSDYEACEDDPNQP